MTLFDKREQAFEAEFMNEEQTRFRNDIKALHLLVLWAMTRAGVDADHASAYADEAVSSAIILGIEHALSEIQKELEKRNFHVTQHELKYQLDIYRARLSSLQ